MAEGVVQLYLWRHCGVCNATSPGESVFAREYQFCTNRDTVREGLDASQGSILL